MYKLLNFISIYILSIINFAILLLPLIFVFIPIIFTGIPIENKSIISVILLIFLLINLIVLLSLFFDLICGFSTKFFIKETTHYLKIKNYDLLSPVFEDLKLQFNRPDVELMVSNSQDVNAFAIGNFKKQYIVLTKGIVAAYLMEAKGNIESFVLYMKCIMGHEMSHLINKDYLPGLLLKLNEIATDFVSRIIIGILNIFLNLLQYIPFVGKLLSNIVFYLYKFINFVISFFHKYVILSVYKFFQLKISRTNEYRCDSQSALASGGVEMSKTLALLGESGYTTIFSTHPKTKDRMNFVAKFQKTNNVILPDAKNSFANFIVILFIILFPLMLWFFIDMKGLNANYQHIILNVLTRFRMLKIKWLSLLKISN